MQIDKLFGEVLKWNVAFQVEIPSKNLNLEIFYEEYKEYSEAKTEEERIDALGDMIVVLLGIAAKLVILPAENKSIKALAQNQVVKINDYVVQSLTDSVLGNYQQATALSEILAVLDIELTNRKQDTDKVVMKIMEYNWKKFWTEAEVKTTKLPSVKTAFGYVVKNETGKIQKPPSFVHL